MAHFKQADGMACDFQLRKKRKKTNALYRVLGTYLLLQSQSHYLRKKQSKDEYPSWKFHLITQDVSYRKSNWDIHSHVALSFPSFFLNIYSLFLYTYFVLFSKYKFLGETNFYTSGIFVAHSGNIQVPCTEQRPINILK